MYRELFFFALIALNNLVLFVCLPKWRDSRYLPVAGVIVFLLFIAGHLCLHAGSELSMLARVGRGIAHGSLVLLLCYWSLRTWKRAS